MPSIKFQIPHPNEEGCVLTGIIEQQPATMGLKETDPHVKPIALVGLSVNPTQSVKPELNVFFGSASGNHESNGIWYMGEKGFINDLQDINAVVAYLKAQYGYRVDLAIGHSRGSIVGMRWLATAPEGQDVSSYVNVSGRYRMKLHTYYDRWREGFEKKGIFHWKVRVAGKEVVREVRPADIRDFEEVDTSFVWTKFPQKTDVLTIHGLDDLVVQPFDAMIYARAFSNRPTATHTLHYVEGADHNFIGHYDEVVDTILGWWDQKTKGKLKDGVWLAGVKPKL
ncbi:hypothetical protein FS837_001747 [Tulasnella sp. UAMH 9824]|nr:hypothetical protein FS837_001747 [Tulasnella sp. UAMH 9824]